MRKSQPMEQKKMIALAFLQDVEKEILKNNQTSLTSIAIKHKLPTYSGKVLIDSMLVENSGTRTRPVYKWKSIKSNVNMAERFVLELEKNYASTKKEYHENKKRKSSLRITKDGYNINDKYFSFLQSIQGKRNLNISRLLKQNRINTHTLPALLSLGVLGKSNTNGVYEWVGQQEVDYSLVKKVLEYNYRVGVSYKINDTPRQKEIVFDQEVNQEVAQEPKFTPATQIERPEPIDSLAESIVRDNKPTKVYGKIKFLGMTFKIPVFFD